MFSFLGIKSWCILEAVVYLDLMKYCSIQQVKKKQLQSNFKKAGDPIEKDLTSYFTTEEISMASKSVNKAV